MFIVLMVKPKRSSPSPPAVENPSQPEQQGDPIGNLGETRPQPPERPEPPDIAVPNSGVG